MPPKPKYIPPKNRIDAERKKIQATWTAKKRARRTVKRKLPEES